MPPSALPCPALAGKDVLVTGGSGSFGKAFVRRALDSGVRRIVVFSRGEARQAEMKAGLSDPRIRFVIGDVRDYSRVADACRLVDVVIHAAALKRVEVCDEDASEAKATNCDGTEHVARACIERGVQKAILLSTDKASCPSTHYGSTKLTAEGLWIHANRRAANTTTRLSLTRYGNVLASTGSVVPMWRTQADTGPIDIRRTDATRFWMTMDDAVNLVCLAITEMRGGEIFVPKCKASSLSALANAVVPGVAQRISRLGRGEKLHESLLSEDESRYAYDYGDHFRIEPERTWETCPRASGYAPAVVEGLTYRSDTAPQLSVEELREMIAA